MRLALGMDNFFVSACITSHIPRRPSHLKLPPIYLTALACPALARLR